MPINIGSVTPRMLGDAGEHYALSQFTFAGKPASKMPDGWCGYDLAVETGHGLARVSVKTRSESEGWSKGSWFMFDERMECDWLVFIFRPKAGPVRSWVIPFSVANKCETVARLAGIQDGGGSCGPLVFGRRSRNRSDVNNRFVRLRSTKRQDAALCRDDEQLQRAV